MYEETSEDLGPRGTFETYRAEGDALYKNGEYRKAIESYTTALELKPTEKNCLVARSRCHLQLGETEKALQDAEASLKEDKEFHKGLFQKADALYCKGEFELALMFYHRGHKMRPELQEFRLGIQKAQEAIDNCVGSPEKVELTKEGDLSFFHVEDQKPKAKGKTQGYHRPPTRAVGTKKEEPKSALNDKTVKQLLGELYGDRVYLEKLMKETDPSTQSGRTIYDLVNQGLQYLDTRTDFWRQQKPMYARKRDRMLQQAKYSKKNKDAPNDYIIKELEKIDEEYSRGKYGDSLKRAKRCLKLVEGYSEEDIDNRPGITSNLHSCHGNAYLELGDYESALYHYQTDLEIAEQNKLDDAKSRALDNLGRVHARSGSFQKAIDAWSTKLPLTKSPLENTWLYHEIGRCHLELLNFKEAKEFGEKSQASAQEAKDDMWQLNAAVLIAQSEAKMSEFKLALQSFENALDMAMVQGDTAAESAIKKAMQEVNNKIVEELKKERGAQDEKQMEKPVESDSSKSEELKVEEAKSEEKYVEETKSEEKYVEETKSEEKYVEETKSEEKYTKEKEKSPEPEEQPEPEVSTEETTEITEKSDEPKEVTEPAEE